MTVLLADEQTVLRELLHDFIVRMGGFSVVASTATHADAVAMAQALKPELAIIDCAMPDPTRLNIAAALRQCSPTTRLLVLSSATEAGFVQDAVAAGAVGFIEKSADLEMLGRAIRAVAQGRQFFSPRVSSVLRELLQRRAARTDGDLLTHREREVLREIAKGRYSKEVAAAFGLSVFTIENIRRRIMRKTGLRSVAELALFAAKIGLVSSPGGVAPESPPSARRSRSK